MRIFGEQPWGVSASGVTGAGGDQRLFALRALSSQPLERLRAVDPDPAGAFERGAPDVITALADLELDSLGLATRQHGR